MTESKIGKDLSEIKSEDDFIDRADTLIEKWKAQQIGFAAVKPILLFMETHPDWDFGMPGAFVHFMEEFYRLGYEEALVSSIARHPTAHTVWMLNRIINGESDSSKKINYLNILQNAKKNSLADQITIDQIDEFLSLHGA